MNPDEHTAKEHYLPVGNGHKLYVHDWGNKKAKLPIIYLHGGPGGGTGDSTKQLFDPALQRVIFFDQRGSGKSQPKGSLKNNTTDDLISDIEKIADHFKLNSFVLSGGSWGSCLALAYGIRHPKRIRAMVLRGIFTGSKEEIDYLDKGAWRTHFPELWDEYLSRTPKEHRLDPSKYHIEQIHAKSKAQAKKSAYAYSEMEGSLLRLDDRRRTEPFEEFDEAYIKIETHYLKNTCFMLDKHILSNAGKLRMPVWLVQGRYDMICPPINAYNLHKKLPNSKLIWSVAGHTVGDRNIYEITRALLLEITS